MSARSSNPTEGYEDEGIRRFEDYHGDGNKDGSTAAKKKGRIEHFGITLEKEEEGKCDVTAHQDKKDMARIKCYLCQKAGHFNGECPNKDQRPNNGASTSGPIKEEDTQSISSSDFTIWELDAYYWDDNLITKEERDANARSPKKVEAIIKTERDLAYTYSDHDLERVWKGELGIREEVVTCKLYLRLAFIILTLERVTIGCCEVGGDGGSGGGSRVVGGMDVVCGVGGVDCVVRGVDCGVFYRFVCGGVY
nr:hypothetical protein [Tanacetum cinerariifolium]